jgi:ATP-binding cassette subfamily B protein
MAIDQADLREVLESLPQGEATLLGENGGLVSGGEGQRVRLGRAMMRSSVRLVLLDEPFRGLGPEQRAKLLARCRELWKTATLLCVTHGIAETDSFDRVLVMEDGKLVEDGAPESLGAETSSRYHNLRESEEAVRAAWAGESWRRLELVDGKLAER